MSISPVVKSVYHSACCYGSLHLAMAFIAAAWILDEKSLGLLPGDRAVEPADLPVEHYAQNRNVAHGDEGEHVSGDLVNRRRLENDAGQGVRQDQTGDSDVD